MEVLSRGALLTALLCLASAHADSTCKKTCKGAGGPFIEGNVYKYQLEGSTATHLPGSPNEVTSLGISATAEVYAESKCQHVLKLSNVQVKGPDGKNYDGLKAAKPVKFSYNDGKLVDLCGESDDGGAGLNVKRAVISLLSSAKKKDGGNDNGYENDVFGICPTEYTFTKDGSKLTIHKTKNLNRCALREDFNFPFPTTTYQAVQSSFGTFETSPLLGAQLTVNQELDGGVLQKASGEEVYNYRPLVNPEAGATVKVSYTLTLQGSSPGSIPANVNTPKQVFYETSHDDEGIKNSAAISAALQKATAALDPVATPEAAKEFSNLVYVIEQGSKADILQSYNAAQGKTAKNLFLDGLLYAGSADSVEAAAELLSSKQIPEESAIRWYLDLNFVKHASRGSLTSLLPLLSGDKVPDQAYLGIGAVAGKFCLEHAHLCDSSPEFKAILSKLAAPLNGGCKVDSHEKENKIIASLKGLRNARHLTDEVAQKVSQCASDKAAKTRVRVAAIEAFHADASKPVLKDTATAILKDVEEDSELRIKAYLALVESPCPKAADTIKELVDHEPINQVGSFVVSHLRNLRASVSPDKEAAKQFFGNIISKKKYPIDQRKFSRNYEVSYSLDALNVGAVGEVNRIFSQKSFIPRSISMNLTTQLFGHSVNLVEIGLRSENLEYQLEKYFGPKGVFKTKGTHLFNEAYDKAEDALKKAKEQADARIKRSISKQETEAATSKIQLGPDYEDLHTDLDLSVKLFGSDIAWINYHQDKLDYEDLQKKLHSKFDESLDKSKSIDIDYKKARTFLDAGVTYPTGLGFGLKVKVLGNSAINVKVNGKADMKAIFNHPQNTHIAFQVVPSASVELSSLLAVDADVVETGVKVSANLHSSTGSDLTVKVLDGYGIDVKLGLPVKKQDILNFHSDVVSTVREKNNPLVEAPIKFNVKRQEHGGCFDQLSAMTGLTVCGEVSVPMEGFKMLSPAYGPSKASLRLEKDDESLTAYHFRAFYNNKQPNQISLDVLLDTPNSKTNRKFSLLVQGSTKPQKQLLITLVSPFKQASFEGLVIDTESQQAISAKLESDGSEYSFKVGAHVSGDANRKKYEPLLEYKYPESAKPERAWIGRKGAKSGKQPQSTLGITGAIFVEKNPGTQYRKYELKAVTLTTPKIKLTVDGTITIDSNLVATDLKASYEKETFTLNSKIQKLEDNKYIAKIDFLPSQYPDLGGSIKWEYEKSPTKVENKLVVVHGADLKSEQSRLSLTQSLTYKYESVKVFDISTENSVSYPLLAISASVKGRATPKSFDYDVDVTYDKTQVKSKLDAKTGGKHVTDYSVDFEAKALGNSIDFSSKHERVSQTKSKFTNSLELHPGGKYQLNAIAELNAKTNDFFQSLDAELKMPQEPKSVKIKTQLKHNSKEEEVEFQITAGKQSIIDFEFELEKNAEPSGKFKLLLPKYINGEGSFETKSGKGTGSFHVDILKTGRKIEGSGELTKTETHVKGSGELLWDAKKDPTKKVHFETDTEYTGKSIDSKNSLQVLEYKTEANVKGSLEGSLSDGTLIGDAELVLPSGRVLGGKVNRVVHLGTDDNKIEGTWELYEHESKGAPPRKLALKIAGKNINPAKVQFDGQADLTYVTPNQEDITLHVVGKKIPQGDMWTISGQGSLTGSMVKVPLQAKLNAEVSEQLFKGQLTADKKFPSAHYDFELKAGSDISVAASGKVNQDQLNNEIEMKLPADLPVTALKWTTANTISVFVPEGSEKKIVTNNEVRWNGDNFVKVNVENVEGKDSCHGKVTWESHKFSARSLTYKVRVDEKAKKVDLDLTLEYEGKKADVTIKADGTSNPIHLTVVSNVPDHGKFEVDISHKENDGGESGETAISASGKNQKLAYSSRYSKSKTTPYLDINLELPQGKSRFYWKLEKKGEKHVLLESKVVWFSQGGGTLDLNGEVNAKSIDDFFVKMFIDSPKLNLNKVEFEAKKEADKSIAFHGKTADKEISGSLAVESKATLPNIFYEGSGQLKVGDKTYPLEFKLKHDVDKGKRMESDFEIKAGKYSYTSHALVENDEAAKLFKIDASSQFCKESGCNKKEFSFRNHRSGLIDYEASTLLKLEKVFDETFVFKSQAKRQGWQYDNNMEVEYGPEKLQYHGYVQADQAGVELVLPKRTIAAEVSYDVPRGKKGAAFKIEADFWLDKKNNAADKTSVLLNSETNKLPDGLTSSSEVRFNTPGLKELSVKGELSINTKDHVANAKLEADVFSKKNQKLVVEYKAVGKREAEGYSGNSNLHIHSKGLNIEIQLERKTILTKTSYSNILTGFYIDSKQAKREGIAKLSFDPKSFVLLVKLPEGVLYSADVQLTRKGKEASLTAKFQSMGIEVEEVIDVTPSKSKGTIIQKGGSNPQIDWDFAYESGLLAEFNLKFNKKSLLSLEVALDDAHFLKSKHSYDTQVLKDLVKLYRENAISAMKEASKIFKETGAKIALEVTDKAEDIHKALPNFKPAVQHYQKELQQMKEEFTSNKNVKDAIDFLKSTFGVLFTQIGGIIQEITSTTEHLITLYTEAVQKITASVKAVIPKLKQSFEKVSDIFISVMDDVLKLANSAFNTLLDTIKEHEKEIQELTSTVADFLHDIGALFAKSIGELQKEISDFVKVLWDQLQALPAYNMLKEKLQELKNYKVPEQFWESYHEVITQSLTYLPTPELRELMKSVSDMLEKLVKQQPFNKGEALKQLYKEFIAAAQSVIAIIESHKPTNKNAVNPDFTILPVPSFAMLVVPPGTFRFSLLNWVRSSDLPTLSDIYHTYRPRHTPMDLIPPFTASAQLVGGTEFFTFDQKHYSFKGSCSYILAKDIIDGNFTAVANMEAGKLKSIAVFDRENSVELLHDNNVLVNGNPGDLPAHVGDLFMFRKYDDGFGFGSEAGFMSFCTPHLSICAFSVNGFYFGKTRGLLGTYNNEPYDDIIGPEGKVAQSTAQFANSWKVSAQCSDGAVHEQPAPAADECTKLFSGSSSLRGCFSYENPDNYREACNKQVADASGEAKQEKACNIARSYVGYCYYVNFVKVNLPDYCGKCQVGSQSIQIGESVSVKTPQKEADIVFIVEQLEDNEEVFKNLVTPLVSTLTNDLKEKGVTDVNFALIGYGAPGQHWSSLYTFNGKYTEFSGTAKNIEFKKQPEITKPKLSDKIEELLEKVKNEIGITKTAMALRQAFEYPYRPEALKTVVGVMSSSCDSAMLPFQSVRMLMHRLNLLNSGLVLNLVTPLKDLKLEGKDEKTAANVVGFDSDSVYTQGEAKRKVIKGDEEAYKSLKYTSDICVDLTLGVKGMVFSSTNFVKGKPGLRKNFLQVMSNKITDSLTSEELKKECKCELEKGMTVRTKCKIISRKEKESLKGGVKGGAKG